MPAPRVRSKREMPPGSCTAASRRASRERTAPAAAACTTMRPRWQPISAPSWTIRVRASARGCRAAARASRQAARSTAGAAPRRAGTSAAGCARGAATARRARARVAVRRRVRSGVLRGELVEQAPRPRPGGAARARAPPGSRETPRPSSGATSMAQHVAPVPPVGVAFVVDPRESARIRVGGERSRAADRAAVAAAPGR